jgi:hypothetical protein
MNSAFYLLYVFFSISCIARLALKKKRVCYNCGHYTIKTNQDEQPLNNLKHDRRSSEELQGVRGPKPDAKTLVNSTVAYHRPTWSKASKKTLRGWLRNINRNASNKVNDTFRCRHCRCRHGVPAQAFARCFPILPNQRKGM